MSRKPNVARFKASLDRKTEAWIEGTARPYLASLLATAQARMPRRELRFDDGMGMSTLYVDRERHPYRFFEAIEAVVNGCDAGTMTGNWRQLVNDRDRRYAERFPELVQFVVFLHEVEDALGQGLFGEIQAIAKATPT